MIPTVITENGTIKHPLFQYLFRIDLDLTGLCNRQCSFCPRSLDAVPLYPNINKQMSLETVEIVIRELRQIDFQGWVELAGRGESTLHKNFAQIVDMLKAPDHKWKVRLTTNGYKIDSWWDTVGYKLDQLILNSYESHQEYIDRQEKYKQLPSGGRVYHYYKQDGLSIQQMNKQPGYMEDGKMWRHAFNNRAGYFDAKEGDDPPGVVTMPNGKKLKIDDMPCWHPSRQIFIDFDGNYQMCCNDWTYQIKIGNIHKRSMIDMYLNDPKINRIRWLLINRNRAAILPCAKCDDIQGATAGTVNIISSFKNTPAYKEHVVPLARIGKSHDRGLKEGR